MNVLVTTCIYLSSLAEIWERVDQAKARKPESAVCIHDMTCCTVRTGLKIVCMYFVYTHIFFIYIYIPSTRKTSRDFFSPNHHYLSSQHTVQLQHNFLYPMEIMPTVYKTFDNHQLPTH